MYNLFVSGYRRRTKFESQYDPDIYLDKEIVMPMQDTLLEAENVKRAMAHLSTDHKKILMMICIKGMSYQEVADDLDLSIGTVRSRLSRARERLQIIMEEPKTFSTTPHHYMPAYIAAHALHKSA